MVSDTANTTRMTGAEAIVASLEALGVSDVFVSVTSRARATPPKATPWPPVRSAAQS